MPSQACCLAAAPLPRQLLLYSIGMDHVEKIVMPSNGPASADVERGLPCRYLATAVSLAFRPHVTICHHTSFHILYLFSTVHYLLLQVLTYLLTYLWSWDFLRSCQLCSLSGTSQHFKEPQGSSPCSQEPSTGPYPERDRSSPYYTILSSYYFK
jgi:hypothetical protein